MWFDEECLIGILSTHIDDLKGCGNEKWQESLHADLVKRLQEHEAVTTEFLEDKKHTISSRHPRVSQAVKAALLRFFSRVLHQNMTTWVGTHVRKKIAI